MSAALAKKPTHHPDTGLPFVEPPANVQKLIENWDVSLDSVRCYVSPIEAEGKTEGGLYMPETAKGHNFKSGWVISAGPSARLELFNEKSGEAETYRVRPGDRVHWGKFAGAVTDRLDKGEKDLKIMNCAPADCDGDVLGIISHGR